MLVCVLIMCVCGRGNSIHLLSAVTDPALLALTLRKLRCVLSACVLRVLASPSERVLRICVCGWG